MRNFSVASRHWLRRIFDLLGGTTEQSISFHSFNSPTKKTANLANLANGLLRSSQWRKACPFLWRKNIAKKRLSRGVKLITRRCPYFFGISLSVYNENQWNNNRPQKLMSLLFLATEEIKQRKRHSFLHPIEYKIRNTNQFYIISDIISIIITIFASERI